MEKIFDFLEKNMVGRVLCAVYGSGTWHGSVLSSKKDQLELLESFNTLDEITEFGHSEHIPVLVAIYDSGILWYVKEEVITPEIALEYFEQEVPTADIDDFHLGFQENVLTIARRDLIDDILSQLALDERLIHVSMGPVTGIQFSRVLVDQGVTNDVGKFSYQLSDSMVRNVMESELEEAIRFDGKFYDRNQLIELALAVDYFGGFGQFGDTDTLGENRKNFLVSNLFAKAKLPVLVLLLLIFSINGWIFFQLSEKNEVLNEQSGTLELLDEKLSTLNGYIKDKQLVMESVQGKGDFSIIADRVGASLPGELKLTRLELKPELDDNTRDVVFESDKVIINGVAFSTRAFIRWISNLEESDWVHSIENQNYEDAPSGDEGGEFQLTIRIHVEES